MNPEKAEDRKVLMDRVESSRKKLAPIRKARNNLLKLAAGSEWYPEGSTEKTPINQMAQAENTFVQSLVGGEPRALVVAGGAGLEALAYEQTLALAHVSQLIGMRRKLRRLVRDALYGIGICRIGMAGGRSVASNEVAPDIDEEAVGSVRLGKMLLEVISFDKWVHDCSSDTIEERSFCGHAYWIDKEDVGTYLPGVDEAELTAEEKRWTDETGNPMAGAISRGQDSFEDDKERYWLWDIWLPRENALVTMPVKGTGALAHVRKWDSRPGGPYMFLYYRELSDQAMPASKLADLAIVHQSLNSTFRKLMEQTRNQKTILGYKPGHEDDARRVLDASSRDAIQMRDPSAVQEHNFNGPDQALLAMLLQTRELASIIGGNTDSIAGLSPQADTLGQEEMIQQQSGGQIADMQMETVIFTTELFEAVRWYLYHEQFDPIPIVKEVGPIGLKIYDEWSAGKVRGMKEKFDAFKLRIEPYSMTYRSPMQRLNQILQLWQGVILPGLQTGMIKQTPDMNRLLEIVSQYADLPELMSILRNATPEEMENGGGDDRARQSPVTTRNYVRRGAPGPTNSGAAMQAMQAMNSNNRGAQTQ
jgi:hypothetical protein